MKDNLDIHGTIAYLDRRGVSVSKNTVYSLIQSGDLPAFRFGKRWYCAREDLDRVTSPPQRQTRPPMTSPASAGSWALA